MVLVGDVMLGRGVAPIAARDPEGLFEDVRYAVASADIAAGNLESPLTHRPHIATNPNDLTADPASAELLSAAGFDLMSVANNHSGDAGRASVADTVGALEGAGMVAIGGGATLDVARAARIVESAGVRLAFLAFDATGAGWPAGPTSPGIAHWDDDLVRSSVERASRDADVVVVSVHGGIEYLLDTDPQMADLSSKLAEWGADVVWGHGPHTIQPVYVEGDTLVATSLGNFLFDQGRAITETGAVLEVMADAEGVVAYRVGTAGHPDRRVRFDGWELPQGDAVLLDGEWWTPMRPVGSIERGQTELEAFAMGTVTDADVGDVTGDGRPDLVVSYRRDARPHQVREAFADHPWEDASGQTAHLGVFEPTDHTPLWAGGALFRPVAKVVACDDSVALAFDTLDDPALVATSGWTWNGFGFDIPLELPGPGTPGCADVDTDGRTEPVILDRQRR
jgi:poly-gamma-glutamate synthesis protein (capsule biosynthesis protein)